MEVQKTTRKSLSMVSYNDPIKIGQVDKVEIRPPIQIEGIESPDISKDKSDELEDLLNEILPPITWEVKNDMWQQTVSTQPASREDVIRLQGLLDTRLARTQARGAGLCAIRHGIYAECFDELIRQVTINCPERGLLLLRIRDEMKMTLDACEILYCNAVDFGIRKAIQAAREREALGERVKDLEVEQVSIERTIGDMKNNFEQTEVRTAELYAAEERKFEEQLTFVKKANAQLKSQLEAITAPRK